MVQLTNPSGGANIGDDIAIVSIEDIEFPGRLSLSSAFGTVGESDMWLIIGVERLEGSDGRVGVNYQLYEGTADDTDFVRDSGGVLGFHQYLLLPRWVSGMEERRIPV